MRGWQFYLRFCERLRRCCLAWSAKPFLARIVFVVLGLVLAANLVRADPYYELVGKIENPKGPTDGSGDEFGISLAQVGENLVVGAYRDDTGALDAGAAYVFDRNGDLLSTIHNPTPANDDWFGFEVRAVSDRIIVAAENDSTAGFNSGSVYLYDQQGNLLRSITNPTPAIDDDFGWRILGVGDKILVTAWKDDTVGTNAGAAYLFDQEGNLLQEFYSPNPQEDARFGRTVDSVGDAAILISAYRENVAEVSRSGTAYLFDLEGNLLQTFLNPDPDEDDLFGIGIASAGNGEHILIGAVERTPASAVGGTAYLYDLEGNLRQSIANPSPETDDVFGRTMIGVGEDMFLVGATFDKTLGDNTGAAYLYSSSGMLLQTFLPPEPAPGGHFSLDLATLDDLILIGSHFDGGRFTGPGAVYVYGPLPPLPGDYNADQIVDQADLDLVLLNWGEDGSTPPEGWVRNLPGSLIDQVELDNVLLNWGQTTAAIATATGVPEPTTFGLGCLAALMGSARLIILRRDRRPRRCGGSR